MTRLKLIGLVAALSAALAATPAAADHKPAPTLAAVVPAAANHDCAVININGALAAIKAVVIAPTAIPSAINAGSLSLMTCFTLSQF